MYLLLVVNFSNRSGCDTWPTEGLTWHTLYGIAWTLDEGLAEQSLLRNDWQAPLPSNHEQTVHVWPIYDWSARNTKHTSPDNHFKKAWSSLIVWPIKPWPIQHPFRSKRNSRTRMSCGNNWQSEPRTSTASRDKKALDRNIQELSLSHCKCQATWPRPWKAILDREPSRPPIKWWHASSSQLL